MAVSFDVFGTLVTIDPVPNPADAVQAELAARDIPIPNDWQAAYQEPHFNRSAGKEIPLHRHVSAALASREITVPESQVTAAVSDAFDPTVHKRDGAETALKAAAEYGPVGVLSNCSVPGLAETTLARGGLADLVDVVVTSVACGWRKPSQEAFETIAEALNTRPDQLLHVGDDPATDGGATSVGATAIVDPTPRLDELPATFAEVCPP